MSRSRIAALVGFLVGLGALLLQISISLPARMSQGDNLLGALIWFFTYFTILTNLMLVLVYLSEITSARWLNWWRLPNTRGMMAGAIALVMGFYHFVLAAQWTPEGLFWLADIALHYATPVLYLLWWLVFGRSGLLRVRDVPLMLLPPLVWLAWAMGRGAIVNEYPYPVLEAHVIGYPAVLANVAGLLVILLLLFVAVVVIDRLLPRTINA